MKGLQGAIMRSFLAGALTFSPYITRADVLLEVVPENMSNQITKFERGQSYNIYNFINNDTSEAVRGVTIRPTTPFAISNPIYMRPDAAVDFFDGNPMSFQMDRPLNQTLGLVVQSEFAAPPGKTGKVYRYQIDLDLTSPLGTFDFSIDQFNTDINTPTGDSLPFQITDNYQFKIMPKKSDVNGDALVDANDINDFTQALLGNPTLRTGENYAGEYCDWSGDDNGQVDGRDIQGFLENYLANGQ